MKIFLSKFDFFTGTGAAGPYTREASTLGYNEFCEVQTSANGDKWTIVQDKTTKVPYAYKSNQWIGYDDIASVNEKARYVREVRNQINFFFCIIFFFNNLNFFPKK